MALLEVNWHPSRRDLRWFAGTQLAVASVVAWLLYRQLGWSTAAIGLVAISLAACVVGLAWPQQLRHLFVMWMLAAFPLGWVLSHLLLAVVYYGIVTPIGWGLRFTGRDALQIKPSANVTTYWVDRRKSPEVREYFRQF